MKGLAGFLCAALVSASYGARYYDADIGMWISPDPARQFHSPYAYSPNPVNTVDPDGRFSGPSTRPLNNFSTVTPQERIVAQGLLQIAATIVPGGYFLSATRAYLLTSTSLSFKLGLAYSGAEIGAQALDGASKIAQAMDGVSRPHPFPSPTEMIAIGLLGDDFGGFGMLNFNLLTATRDMKNGDPSAMINFMVSESISPTLSPPTAPAFGPTILSPIDALSVSR